MSRTRKRERVCRAHVAPPPVPAPKLAEDTPRIIQLEREVEDEYRGQMLARLEERIAEVGANLSGTAPRCVQCGAAMKSRGRRPNCFLTRFGQVRTPMPVYACPACGTRCHPWREALGLEVGRISGALARLLALLGVVVPYELAARLAFQFFGVEVSAMSVWRCVQRLGEASEQYTEQLARHHADPRSEAPTPAQPPNAVVLGVDGCALGMQVHAKRRRRTQPDERLPRLPPVEDGHFREVKTGVLLLPSERVEPSPGRHSVVRRALVSCLGQADRVFERLWSKLHELNWFGPQTVVVIVGDGAEWIWNRAQMFPRRCEILDFWHAVEKAWEYARLHWGQGTKVGEQWARGIAEALRAGKVEEVIETLRLIETATPEQRDKRDALIRYYTDNQERMRYDEYLRLGYGIGSGAVESAHKQVTHARMRQAGMRWSEAGARRLLALRILLLNRDWTRLDRLTMKHVAA